MSLQIDLQRAAGIVDDLITTSKGLQANLQTFADEAKPWFAATTSEFATVNATAQGKANTAMADATLQIGNASSALQRIIDEYRNADLKSSSLL